MKKEKAGKNNVTVPAVNFREKQRTDRINRGYFLPTSGERVDSGFAVGEIECLFTKIVDLFNLRGLGFSIYHVCHTVYSFSEIGS